MAGMKLQWCDGDVAYATDCFPVIPTATCSISDRVLLWDMVQPQVRLDHPSILIGYAVAKPFQGKEEIHNSVKI